MASPQTRHNNRNRGNPPIGGNQSDGAGAGLGWKQSMGWVANAGHYLTEQFSQLMGPIAKGRIYDVYTTTKTCEVVFAGGHGVMPYGEASLFISGGILDTPSPGDHCLLWNPSVGDLVLIAYWPPEGDSTAVPFQAVDQPTVSSLYEERHVMALNPGNQAAKYHNSGRPFDLLSGDWGKMSNCGAMIALLGELAIVKASPMAQVQCNLVDDSVRIISRTFEHWFIGGSSSIQVDRDQVNLEFTMTDTLSHALGKDAGGDQIDIESSNKDRELFVVLKDPKGIPKERVQVHVGHNADLVHMFVTKPVTGDSSLANDNSPVGIAEFFVGGDGAVALRSARSISVSKVSRIRVPKRKANPWETPKTTPEDIKQFDYDPANPNGRHLATPDDVKWRREVKEVSKFRKREDFYPLKTTEQIQDPKVEGNEKAFRNSEVTVELRDDGSGIIYNSIGSSIELTVEGDIRIHAARDLIFESGRDTRGFAGHDYSNRARKNIEFTSSLADFRVKAEKNVHIMSREGGMVIETFSSGVPGPNDSIPERSKAGIVIRSNEDSPVYIEAKKDKILCSSQLETAFRVVAPSEKVYIEAGRMQVNLARGPELFELTGTEVKIELDGRFGLTTAHDIDFDSSTGFFVTTSGTIWYTGSVGYWFANGDGVNIAHTHPMSEWTYAPDSPPDAEGHGILIVKRTQKNASQNTPVEVSTFDKEADPHTPAIMANAIAGFRPDAQYPQEPWYQTLWQKKKLESGSYGVWDLIKTDEVSGSAPYPGLTFPERLVYTVPAPDPDFPVAQKAGVYSMGSLRDYTIVEG